jgi:hypothetical protein
MIQELDRVVLIDDLPEYGLVSGDVGTVVLVHRGGEGFEVEFVALDGYTIAIVTLLANQVRPVAQDEIAHARTVAVPHSSGD